MLNYYPKKLMSFLLIILMAWGTIVPIKAMASEPGSGQPIRVATFNPDAYLEHISEQEARKALENPEEFNRKKKDITVMGQAGAMTAEMAKFYFVVAAVEFTHCITKQDSTQCSEFLESLKSPVGHIGFAIFMKANNMTVDFAHIVTRGKINPGMASYLGLATGMMAQTIFQDIYYHETVQALIKNASESDDAKRIAKRKELLNKLWKEFRSGAGEYLFNKIPNVMGLLGAAYLSHKTTQILGHMFKKSQRLVKFAFKPGTSKAIIRFGSNLAQHRKLGKAGIKYIWKGSKIVRINPVVAIGSYVVETAIFLLWAPIVEDFMVKQWDRKQTVNEIIAAKNALDAAIQNGAHGVTLEKKAMKLAKAYDRWRETIMHSANLTKMRHLMAIQKVDAEFQKMVMYYQWLTSGMDFDSELYKLNELEFHETFIVHQINESTEYAKAFFCGRSAKDAVVRTVDVGGLPMPFTWDYDYRMDQNRTYYENMQDNSGWVSPTGIEVNSVKIFNARGLCEKDIRELDGSKVGFFTGNYDKVMCPIDYDFENRRVIWRPHETYKLFCGVELDHARAYVLRTGFYRGEYIRDELYDKLDDKLAKMMEKIWSQRDLMIMRFERSVRTQLAEALSGLDVDYLENDQIKLSGTVSDYTHYRGVGRISLGFISHLREEKSLWVDYLTSRNTTSTQKETFRKMLKNNDQKLKVAREILDYTLQDFSERVRETDFVTEVPKEDWEKIVYALRQFIIP